MAAGKPTAQPRERRLDEAWELMHFALRAVIARPDALLETRGLSRVHHRILFFVAREPDITVNQLLQVLGVSKQALNQPLRQLYAQKLVTYTPAPSDRRQRRLVLTEAGRELERRLTEPQHAMFEAALRASGTRGRSGMAARDAAHGRRGNAAFGKGLTRIRLPPASPGLLRADTRWPATAAPRVAHRADGSSDRAR
jgi:DNA-binding MarR family transcriptional regulator